MNTAESAALKNNLNARGWRESDSAKSANFIIINTCSVRATAEQRVFGRLAYYKAQKAAGIDQKLLVTGCMASRLGGALLEHGADFVMGAEEKSKFAQILSQLELCGAGGGSCEQDFQFHNTHYEDGAFRAFVPIMHGCNNFCSYCIVPFVRGREVSRPPDEIKREIEFLASRNVREITLLGQNVNSYRYKSVDFPALLQNIALWTQDTPVRRVRFLSSHPKDFSPRTIEALCGSRVFCRHIHLPVQHGSNRVLAAMNRRYTRETFLDLVSRLREALPDLSLSTDILAGFPGETEAEFEEVLTLMNEVKFLRAFMYHYNVREGTAAAALPGRLSEEVKRERLARVIALQKEHTRAFLQNRLGKTEDVLVEGLSKKSRREVICRTEQDEMVVCEGGASLAGSFISVRILELRGNTLAGEVSPRAGNSHEGGVAPA